MDEKSDALCTEPVEAPAEAEAVESAGSGGDADFSASSCSELTATALDALISEATAEDPPSDIVSGLEGSTSTTETLPPETETPVTSDTLTVPTEESPIVSMSETTTSPQEVVDENTQDNTQDSIEENNQENIDEGVQENTEENKIQEDIQETSQENSLQNSEENIQEDIDNSVVSSEEKEEKPAVETVVLDADEEPVADKPDETKLKEEATSPLCDLEEELKRLHGGEEASTEIKENDIGPKDALESVGLVEKKQLEETLMTLATGTGQRKMVDKGASKPITKISDLEEMLSADDVLKDAEVIQNSQKELTELDLLVCGRCHEVFHILQDFQQHKTQNCSPSNIGNICDIETKPAIWGFTLWKNKQQKIAKKKGEVLPSSWAIYQKWCQMPEKSRSTWVAAGQTLLAFNKVGSAKLTEYRKVKEKDPLALDGMDSNKENSVFALTKAPVSLAKTVRVNKEIAVMPKINDNSNKALRTVRSTETKEYAVEKIIAKRFNPKRRTWEYQVKWENFSSEDNTWEPVGNLQHCKQMVELFEEQLKKQKMEKAKQQQQQANIAKMKARPAFTSPGSSKIGSPGTRPQRTSKQKALDQVKQWCGNISDEDESSRGTKRQHDDVDSDDSFEKKMKWEDLSDDSADEFKPPVKVTPKKIEQVTPKTQHQIQIIKNGVGKSTPLPQNILIPDANGVVRINQKQLPALSTGVYIMSKTAGIIKLDSSTSKVATSGGQTVVKVAPKIGQTQIKIVKKDGTIGGQQIIQVPAQKGTAGHRASPQKPGIGQKVVPTKTTPPIKVYKPVITKVKRIESGSGGASKGMETPTKKSTPEVVKRMPDIKKAIENATRIVPKVKEEPLKKIPSTLDQFGSVQDDSDDGLEELPFPDEIKVPEPESPPGDFVLDPITGKIAGVEYPPAPDPEPLPEPMEEEKAADTLDNIVKLAAADITEEDLKSETPMDIEEPMEQEPTVHKVEEEDDEEHAEDQQESEEEARKQTPLIIRRADVVGAPATAPPHPRTVVRTSSGTAVRRQSSGGQQLQQHQSAPSILNRALTTSTTPKQRTVVQVGPGGTTQRIVQQRVVSHVVPRGTTTVLNPIVRPAVGQHQHTYTRTRPQAPKQRVTQHGQQVHRVVRSPQIVQQPTQKVYYATKGFSGPLTIRELQELADQIDLDKSDIENEVVGALDDEPENLLPEENEQAEDIPQPDSDEWDSSDDELLARLVVQQQQPPTMTRRIGNTTIRSTPLVNSSPSGMGKPPVRVVQTASGGHRYVQRKEPILVRPGEKKIVQQKVHHKPRTIISMPSLSGDEDSISPSASEQKSVLSGGRVVSQQETALHQAVASAMEQESLEAAALADAEAASKQGGAATAAAPQQATLTAGELGTFTLADSDNPIFITGDDGTVYQVAGQNEQGQTILLTQGADGQQQCLLVTNELAEGADNVAVETAATAAADEDAQQQQQQQQQTEQQQQQQQEEQQQQQPQQEEEHQQMMEVGGATNVTEPLSINTGHDGDGEEAGDGDGNDQVVAQVVRTEPPSPGGTHKVVVMLPNGNLMMTQVTPEEYASLELE
nr:unnamed protein product [Callosobruchus chinensis]